MSRGLAQPGIEIQPRHARHAPGHTRHQRRHVVEAVARTDDEHPLIPQRCQSPARGQMRLGTETGLERHLNAGNGRLGKGDLQRHEHPMVETAVPVEGGSDTCGRKQISRPFGKRWRPGAGQVSR